MLAEQIPGPAQSGCGCFMACAKEGQALGHQLVIAHGFAIFVSGLQQYREEVIALCRVVAPLVNEALNMIAQDMYGFDRTKIKFHFFSFLQGLPQSLGGQNRR